MKIKGTIEWRSALRPRLCVELLFVLVPLVSWLAEFRRAGPFKFLRAPDWGMGVTRSSKIAQFLVRRPSSDLDWGLMVFFVFPFYVYANEIHARNWGSIQCGLAFLLRSLLWQMLNALVLHFTQYSALWTIPGINTSLLLFVGLNIETLVVASVLGVVLHKLLLKRKDFRLGCFDARVLGSCIAAILPFCGEVLFWWAGSISWPYPLWSIRFPFFILLSHQQLILGALRTGDRPWATARRYILTLGGINCALFVLLGLCGGWM